MDPINIRNLEAQQALTEIAKMAYGSGLFEGTSGGKGNIGMLNGRVIKFNTHRSERSGEVTNEMLASCNELRLKLAEIARDVLPSRPRQRHPSNAIAKANYEKICEDLGVSMDGKTILTTSLLDRKVVAKVINDLSRAAAQGGKTLTPWNEVTQVKGSLSSKNIDTHFSLVREQTISDNMVDEVLGELATQSSDRPTFTLTPQEANFMKSLVWRERSALLAAGKPLPSPNDFKASVLSGRSPAFVATMYTFGHNTVDLKDLGLTPNIRGPFRLADINRTMGVYFSGAPEAERFDRAELFVTACNTISNDGVFMYGSISIIRMCEKLPEMRRLQPEGRLTCETIWKACFNETLPKELHGMEGTSAFADRLNHRTDELAKDMICKHVPALATDENRLTAVCGRVTTAGYIIDLGVTLEAFMKAGMQQIHNQDTAQGQEPLVPDLHYLFNPSAEKIARGFLYEPVSAAKSSDDTLKNTLWDDLKRQQTIVRLVTNPSAPPTVIDLRSFRGQSNSERETTRDNFMRSIDGFLGNVSRAQRNVVMYGFCQAGMLPLRGMLGGDAEHSDIFVTVARDPQDPSRIIMSYQTADTVEVDARYSYAVNADGSNIQIGEMSVQRRGAS